MGAHSSKEKLSRSYSERYIHTQMIERERFGSFGKRAKSVTKGKCYDHFNLCVCVCVCGNVCEFKCLLKFSVEVNTNCLHTLAKNIINKQ